MKKRMTSVLTLMMAMTMVFGSALTVHAEEDGCYHGTGFSGDDGGLSCDIEDSGSSDSGSSSSESYSEPASSESYDDGCYHGTGFSGDDGGLSCDISYDSGSSDSGSYDAGSSNATSSAPSAASSTAVRKAAGSNTGVTGKEQFRALAKSGQGSYKVTHKGQTIATFWLTDAEGKSVACTAVALKQRTDDKKWAINYEVADATGLTVGAPLDRTYMYKTLGVSYVTINDEIVIDIEAEAAAADEAAKATATAKAAK